MADQTDNLMLNDDTSGLPRTIDVASDDIVLSVNLTLQSGGVLTADNIKRGTADPNAATVAGNEGDIYQRTLNNTGELWVNTDGTTTGWALLVSGLSLQSAYVGGNTITTSGGEGNVTITGTEDLIITTSDLLVDTTSSFSIDSVASSNVTVTGAQLQLSTVTSGELDLTSAGLIDINGAANIDIDVTGTFDVLATTTFSIDGTGASNVSATSGNLTISTITSGTLLLTSAGLVDMDAAANIDIDVTGSFDVLATGVFSIDGTGASNVTATTGGLTLSTVTSGTLLISAAALLDVDAAANIDIDVTGTFDVLATSTFSIDGTGASNVSATSGALTLSSITSGDVTIVGADAVTITAGNEAAATGNLVSLAGGTGGGNNPGGAITLTGGTGGGGGTAGIGGGLTMIAGTGGATGAGGAVTLTGGTGGATSGAGGAVTVQGGTATDGAGGAVNVSGRAGVGTDRAGGAVVVTSGAGIGAGASGVVTVQAGTAGATGAGGAVTVQGGTSGATSGAAGTLTLNGGTAVGAGVAGANATLRGGAATDGAGGSCVVQGRDGTGTDRAGGAMTVAGGTATGTGTGGNVSLFAGTGGVSGTPGAVTISGGAGGSTSGTGGAVTVQGGLPVDGNGGAVSVTGRAGVGTNRSGGALNATAGNATGSGTGGTVTVTAGSGGTTGTAGSIAITAGAGGSSSGAAGAVTVSAGTPVDGAGAGITLTASAGVGTNRAGGAHTSTAGNATGNAVGGVVAVTAGSGGATGTAGTITLTTGAGGSTSGNAGNLILASGNVTSGAQGVVRISNTALEIIESSTVPGPTIAATQGRFWVRNDAPNVPMFTDDSGTDYNLLDGGGGGGPTVWKEPVRAATTSSIALSGEITVDGVALTSGDRVLVKDQDAAIPHGTTLGSGTLSTESGTFVDALCTSPALATGDWFVIGMASHRQDTGGGYASQMEGRFGTTRFALSTWRNSYSYLSADITGGGLLMFAARVTANGSDTLNMRAQEVSGSPGDFIEVGNQSWVYFNLDVLGLNSDYWYAEGANSDAAAVTPSSTTWTADEQVSFTPTETGDYLIVASAEGFNAGGISSSNEYWARLRMNSTTIGTGSELFTGLDGSASDTQLIGPNYLVFDVQTLTASTPYTIGWEFRNASGLSAISYRRQRIYVFRLNAFADSASTVVTAGIQPNNSTVEAASTLNFNFGTSVPTIVLASCDYANNGAFGSGWLRQDGSPDVDFPTPVGYMWGFENGGLTTADNFGELSFAADTTVTGAQVWRMVGQSLAAFTLTFGRNHGNSGNSRMPMIALMMETATSASANGIYVVDSGAWTRASDADTDPEVMSMLTVAVEEGTVNANTYWYLSDANPITVGSSGLIFEQLGASSGGSGLTQAQVLARISFGF